MPYRPRRNWIERIAAGIGVIPDSDADAPDVSAPSLPIELKRYPSTDEWDDFVEYDAKAWPRRAVARHYRLVPTTCFNCESACGLLAYVDKETGKIRKFEGNPHHPGSRGKNCAKGPATINQINDTDRILTPMKRDGPRGSGKWRPVSWDDAISDIAARVRRALQEKRQNEVVYHVGRPGAEGFMDRVLRAWGIDGHNSHTNICSAGARFGYVIVTGDDRPSPDYAHARFILALNAHFESGHYFNPHAQRITEAMTKGCKLAVVDPRLSNTAARADYWMPTIPGTEAALLLCFARVILEENLCNRDFIERWVNWRAYLQACHTDRAETVEEFIAAIGAHYDKYTPEFAESECGVSAKMVAEVGRLIGEAGSRFCAHTWRGAASAHLGGWEVARGLAFLHLLTGSWGTKGGTSPNSWHKYHAHLINPPPPTDQWNELHWPRDYPLAHYEMSFLLPHFLKEGRGKIDVYFTRVFNPVWTYPDGFTWIEALSDESKIGLHIALTPTWNETAMFADYVLPMGHGPERHDLNTYETHSATWIAFRQPVLRAAKRAEGIEVSDTREVNPGEVWEEDEFWIALSLAIDPDGSLGIRKYFESVEHPGQPLTVDEYYSHIFDRVEGLPEKAKSEDLTPLEYMRKYGAFQVDSPVLQKNERKLSSEETQGADTDDQTGVVTKNGKPIGIKIGRSIVQGFPTPSRLLEFYSPTMIEWGWPEYTIPGYIPSHIPSKPEDYAEDEFCLLPTFRLPTLIHTRSGSAKWLNEIAQRNPLWVHTDDAKRLGLRTGDLARVTTEIGYFVDKVWVTESIRPGVVACSHHLGRWRRKLDPASSRWSGSVVEIESQSKGKWRMRQIAGPGPFASPDPDSSRIFWREGGVPQNLTHGVHPDPISGMHCWHQRIRLNPAEADDRCGDVMVDTEKSMQIYKDWLKKTRFDAVEKTGLRRPLWMKRPLRPTDEAFSIQPASPRP